MNIRELITKCGFTVDERGLEIYDKAIGRVYDKAQGLNQNLTRAADNLIGIGQKMLLYISAPLAALATVSVMAKVKLEDLQNEWGVMLGNQEKGIAFTREMMDLEEKGPYEYEQIHAYAKEMHAMGVESDKILPRVKLFMDIAVGSGLDLGFLMSTMQMIDNIGFATGRQVKRLIMSGALDRGTLGKMLGVNLSSGIGMKQMMRMADMGKITASIIESVFQKEGGAGGRYFGAAEQRTHTLKKGFENLWHSIFLFRASLGDMIAKSAGLTKILERLTNFVDKLRDHIDKLSPGWKKFLVITGGIAFAIGPAIVGVGKLLKLFLGLNTALMVMKFSGFLKEGVGIAGMFAMIGKSIGGALLAAAPWIAALMGIYLLFQDIFLYAKYGDKATTLTGSVMGFIKNLNTDIDNTIFNIVKWFMKAWEDVKKWWDTLWSDPWKALRELIPEWVTDLITSTTMKGGPYVPSPNAFSPADRTAQYNISVNVTTPTVAGTSIKDMGVISKHAEMVYKETSKLICDSLYNAHKNTVPAGAH
jgi:hypothetical protein